MKKKLFLLVAFWVVTPGVKAQGNFINLGFESADLVPVPQGQFGDRVPTSQALPGWSAYVGPLQLNSVLHNNFTVGGVNISIFGPNWANRSIIEGQYTVLLQAGTMNESASVSQNGLIPIGSRTLQFKAAGLSDAFTTDFSVSFTGQPLSFIPLSTGPNYTLYGADISAFSGQTGDLRFTALGSSSHPNNLLLDSISFSTISVPEPSALGLFALGGLLLGFSRWRSSLRK